MKWVARWVSDDNKLTHWSSRPAVRPDINNSFLEIRVADAAVMPSVVWADTNPTTIMTGERVAG